MNESTTWRALTTGSTDEVALAIDFDATGRPEARFADLAPHLGPDSSVWETVPLGMDALAGPSGEGYVKRWADEVRDSGRTVTAVMGFCAGGALAPALAAQVGQWQAEPQLILFDPETVTPLTMYWQFAKIIEVATSSLTPTELDEAREAGRQAQRDLAGLEPLADRLSEIFGQVGAVAFPRLGLDATSGAEVVTLFRSFISYLCAAGQFDPLPAWSRATVLTSASPTSGLNGYRTINPQAPTNLAGNEITFPVEHAGMLADPAVAAATRELLGRVRVHGGARS
ncbi:hypothetical protein AB0B63_26320 [Micromonospora sp. NPDC049081]|uniref:hypothetical protein n=1 Tax=Micromonospora sp. NPDC049081 TaxID=3155150 RepID=UPI0033D2339A